MERNQSIENLTIIIIIIKNIIASRRKAFSKYVMSLPSSMLMICKLRGSGLGLWSEYILSSPLNEILYIKEFFCAVTKSIVVHHVTIAVRRVVFLSSTC